LQEVAGGLETEVAIAALHVIAGCAVCLRIVRIFKDIDVDINYGLGFVVTMEVDM